MAGVSGNMGGVGESCKLLISIGIVGSVGSYGSWHGSCIMLGVGRVVIIY